MQTTDPQSPPTTDLLESLAAPLPTEDENWASGPAKGIRIRLPIAGAALAAVALLGVFGGATLKGDDATTVSANRAGNTASAAGAQAAAGQTGTGRGPTGQFPAPGAGGAAAGAFPGGGRGGVNGEVTKIDGDTVTVTDMTGAEVTIKVSDATTYTENVESALSDIKVGSTIAARGTTTDGITDATSITLNPAQGGGFPGGQSPAGATAPPGT